MNRAGNQGGQMSSLTLKLDDEPHNYSPHNQAT